MQPSKNEEYTQIIRSFFPRLIDGKANGKPEACNTPILN